MTESLGPRPTKPQMELLKKLAVDGASIHWSAGIRGADSARLCIRNGGTMWERVRTDTLGKFKDWGWLQAIGDPAWAWRSNEYTLTDKAREVIEKGATR